jgi:hypothetical protein
VHTCVCVVQAVTGYEALIARLKAENEALRRRTEALETETRRYHIDTVESKDSLDVVQRRSKQLQVCVQWWWWWSGGGICVRTKVPDSFFRARHTAHTHAHTYGRGWEPPVAGVGYPLDSEVDEVFTHHSQRKMAKPHGGSLPVR